MIKFLIIFLFLGLIHLKANAKENGEEKHYIQEYNQKLNDDLPQNKMKENPNIQNYVHNYRVKELSSHHVVEQEIVPETYQYNSNSTGFYFNFVGPYGTSMSTGGFVNNQQSPVLLKSTSKIVKDYGNNQQKNKVLTNK